AGGWYSCHSCHTDGHTAGSLADTLGDGAEGAPKRILSLLGAAETGPWSWLGNKERLNDQIHQSLRLTMRGRQLKDAEVADLIAFLKTLDPPPAFQPPASDTDRKLIETGRKLFVTLECSTCHEGRTLTSPDVYDVGLKDALGTKEFNPPSLRGVGHRYRLFHDNRAANIEAVVREHKHQLPRALKDDEARALVRYLKSL
ncbi:MAG: c-type cytochrome, partial [Pirellulales bacterium]|nr:c-type cytochrome [Pirellulales bacterium]